MAALSRLHTDPAERRHQVPLPAATVRPSVRGKFLYVGDEKLWVRGVSYGAFAPDALGREYHDLNTIERDFAQMAANGINAVRIPHTMPPRALLDIAQCHGLRVMVGLSAEQYVGFLIDSARAPDIETIVRERVRSAAGHPALLCYGLGNEIQAPIARLIGPRRLERYIEWLYGIVKQEDPEGLVTYVNYPSTEYLRLPFLDLLCFNVYLEQRDRLAAYLARLQNLAGDRPLLMGELGLDSLRNGEDGQAHVLDWQVRTAFEGGCAGLFIFAWTDEWFRGQAVDDWAFGLTRRDRSPKRALATVRDAFADVPLRTLDRCWPRISVIVCTYNGARTIRQTLEKLGEVRYPDFEVIVVDDGSTDDTTLICREFPVRVVTTANMGLSSARNTGLATATGDIIAYLDDDAYPDRDWLLFLAHAFESAPHAGIGGPNVPPAGDGLVADAVSVAPGGPIHVLLTDQEAEHIPGCNMAFRAEALRAIGGFDPQFRAAGDDVDVCWRIQDRGWTLGFAPAAMVLHHRRDSVRSYWKQQRGYGRAEALLERKWPEKYNSVGHVAWAGRIYSDSLGLTLGGTGRIYHGAWGSAPFQSLCAPGPSLLASLPFMPEWYLLMTVLAGLGVLGLVWPPLFLLLPLFLLGTMISLAGATIAAGRAIFPTLERSTQRRMRRRLLAAGLHLLQPLARLIGRLEGGLTFWRRSGMTHFEPVRPRRFSTWLDRGQPQEQWLALVSATLRERRVRLVHGGDYDRWDIEVRVGMFGAARLLLAVEEHGGGAQYVRVRCSPRFLRRSLATQAVGAALTLGAALGSSWLPAAALALVTALIAARAAQECSAALALLARSLAECGLSTTPVAVPAVRTTGEQVASTSL